MHALCILIGLFTFIPTTYAEKSQPPPTTQQAIGLSLGWVVANGLNYRRYFDEQFLQITFAGAVNKDEDREYIDFSLSYGRYLNTFDLSEDFYPVGVKFVSGIEVERDTNREADFVSDANQLSANELHLGAGFGLDVGNPKQRGLIVSVNIIYTASFRGLKAREFVRLGMLPSIGIHYNL